VTTDWKPDTAKALAETNLTKATAADKGDVSILAPNDGTARTIADSFASDKDVKSYVVTGQDAEKASVQYIIDGKQSMTVYKDTRVLAKDAITAAVAFLTGKTPDKTNTYNNGKADIPAKPSAVVTVEKANVQSVLIDSGQFQASDFTGLGAAAAPAAPASGGKTYVLVPKNLGNPYFDTANNGAQKAAKELGVTVTYTGPATADATQQIQLINSLIAQKVNGLAISADDSDALVPTGKDAIAAGIPVVSWDSAIGNDGRVLHINQAENQGIADIEIKMALDLTGPAGGKIAILSATSTAPNQNAWIDLMKADLKKPENAKLTLATVVYGDDDDTKSYNEATALFKKFPDLKVIIAPTTVGIAASARAVTDAKLIGKVFVTGLGTPNQMRDYVKSGAAPEFALWNPADLGYLAIYVLDALSSGKIKGVDGDKFTAGSLGDFTVKTDPKIGLNVLLGQPFVWNKDNIDGSHW